MTPVQAKLSAEIEKDNQEFDALAEMECSNDKELETRNRMIEEVQARLDKNTAALEFENKLTEKRAAAGVLRKSTAIATARTSAPSASAPAPAAPVTRSVSRLFKQTRGFESPEEADRAGRFLRSVATGEPMNFRGAFTGADEITKSMGERSPLYDGKGSELVPHGDLWNGILGLLSYDSMMVRYGMNLGQVRGDSITVPRSDDDIDADYIAENVEIPPVLIKTGGVKGMIEGIKARCQVSNELIEDAEPITIANLVSRKFGRAFNLRIDKTWLSGSSKIGVDGLLTKANGTATNLPAGHEITQAAAGKVTIDELVQVMGAVNPNARNTVWLVNPKGWGQITSAAKAIIGANLNDGVPLEILGSPVVKCEAVPATHVAVFGDFSEATQFAFKRNGLEIAASRDRAIEYWQTVFVGCLRLAIMNTGMSYVSALKVKAGT